MPMTRERFSRPLTWLLFAASCGPATGDAEGEADASSSATPTESSGSSTGEPNDDDLSWLVGKYTHSCLPYPETPFVHGCITETSFELEFHADGTMTSTHVSCGMLSPQDEIGRYKPGAVSGEAIIEPDAGFDHIYITGPTPAATVQRTDDCMIIEVTTGAAGTLNTGYFVRGEFEYVPQSGCSTEVVATAVPECP